MLDDTETKQKHHVLLLEDDWRKHKLKIFCYGLVLVLDVVSSVVLYLLLHSYNVNLNFRKSLDDFRNDSLDVLLLSILRIILLPILTVYAIRKGNMRTVLESWLQRKQNRYDLKRKKSIQLEEEEEPLLNDTDIEELEVAARGSQAHATQWRNFLLGLIIMLLTLCEVHIGIKVVLFHFPAKFYTFTAVVMSSLVLWISIELWLSRNITASLTREAAHFYPNLHSHPLHFDGGTYGHCCDLCEQTIKESYRCDACDWDLCLDCISKNNKTSAEGLLRTDKGIKEEDDISNWQYMKKGFYFAKNYWILIILAFLFLFIASAPTLLLPNYQGAILDRVIKGDEAGFKRDVILFVLLSASVGICGAIRNLCFALTGQKILKNVQSQLFIAIMKQDIAFFDGISTGDLTSRLWNDAEAMISPINTVLTTLLSNGIELAGGLFMCLFTSWRLSILAFTTIGPITLLYSIYSNWSQKINKEIWMCLSEANSVATEAITNIRTVRAFSKEPLEESKYKRAIDVALNKGIKDSWASAGTFALTSYIDQAISVLLLWYGGTVVLNDPDLLTIGKLITFQLYWNMINSSYQSLTEVISNFTRAGGAAQRVMSLLDITPDINPNVGEHVSAIKGNVQLENVKFYYQMRPETQVLKGINLSIKSGHVCALVGRSGGGKSTLIHLLLRFYDPREGRILMDGQDYKTLNPISLRRHIAVVSQETQLFNMTIEQNIAYGVTNYTKEELYDAARQANAHEFITQFEEGYETRVGDRGTRISGGQKQRIALARVFLKKPSLLLLDEATSSLDTESEALVQEAIDRLIQMRNCTVVLVAHRLSTVINADQIAVIDDGQVIECGNHEQLLEKDGIYAKLVKRQIQKMQNTLEQNKDPKTENTDIIDNLVDL